MTRVLVLDVGTTGLKAVLFGSDGAVIAQAKRDYPTHIGPGSRHEQDPLDWWRAAGEAARSLDVANVDLIALSGTMQSVIPLDAADAPIGLAVLYSDGRAVDGFARHIPALTALGAAARAGNPVDALSAAAKIAWLAEHEAERFAATRMFYSGAKDVLARWLGAEAATDPTAATTVGLMDFDRRAWDPDLCAVFGIAPARLPPVLSADMVIGHLSDAGAAHVGARAGTPILNGAGDAGASTLGAGIARPGETYAYVGTTAWVAQIVATRPRASSTYMLAAPTGPGAIQIGATLAGGDGTAWFSELVGEPFANLDAAVADVDRSPPAAMFLPYLKGERMPFADAAVRAGLVMVDRADGVGALHYAVLEGVALAVAANLAVMAPVVGELVLIGGAALSPVLVQLLADATGVAIRVRETPGATTAYGAFLLAAGVLRLTVAAPRDLIVVQPRPERAARAEQRRRLFGEATKMARALAVA
jgi:xylulokinase